MKPSTLSATVLVIIPFLAIYQKRQTLADQSGTLQPNHFYHPEIALILADLFSALRTQEDFFFKDL